MATSERRRHADSSPRRGSSAPAATRASPDRSSIRRSSMPRRSCSRTSTPCSSGASATSMAAAARRPARRSKSAVSELEGAAGTVLCPSGLSAVSTALLSCVAAGDHILMVDCVYGPVRHFADTVLEAARRRDDLFRSRRSAPGSRRSFDERTRVVYLEAPGSLTFEMQDVPAIAAARPRARRRGRSSTTPGRRRSSSSRSPMAPIFRSRRARNISAAIPTSCSAPSRRTQRPGRRSRKRTARWASASARTTSISRLRGLRTLAVRLERQMESAIAVAEWLARPAGGRRASSIRRSPPIPAMRSGSAT